MENFGQTERRNEDGALYLPLLNFNLCMCMYVCVCMCVYVCVCVCFFFSDRRECIEHSRSSNPRAGTTAAATVVREERLIAAVASRALCSVASNSQQHSEDSGGRWAIASAFLDEMTPHNLLCVVSVVAMVAVDVYLQQRIESNTCTYDRC